MRFFWWRHRKRAQSVTQGLGSRVSSFITTSGYQNDTVPADIEPGPSGVSSELDDSSGSDEKQSYGSVIARHYIPSTSAIDKFTVVECTSREMVLSHCLLVHSLDFLPGVHVMVNHRFPLTTKQDNTGALAPGQVGIAITQRRWMELPAVGAEVVVSPLELYSAEVSMVSLYLEIDFWTRGLDIAERFPANELRKSFINAFSGQIFGLDQQLVFDFRGQLFRAFVKNMYTVELATQGSRPNSSDVTSGLGILVRETEITFTKAAGSRIKIKNNTERPLPDAALAPNFKFEDLGIGGLDKEFSMLFRRALASRILPSKLVEDLGITHVKGILLFGPAGVGKTLLARQLGRVLRSREPILVNGVDSRASKGDLHTYFAYAEKEYEERGEESGLHVIILDELDNFFDKSQLGAAGESNIAEIAMHQLLTKMDQVELSNILFIGTTNRLDMIDKALLRPGRFEVCLGVSLPDEQGRLQILDIHTSKMRTSGRFDESIVLAELASVTQNFSGAEIGALVKSAASFACRRHLTVGTMAGISDNIESLRVNRDDFSYALDEIHPALGASEEELQNLVQHGIIRFDDNINTLLSSAAFLMDRVRDSNSMPLYSILLHGPPGSGKTALAATIAQASQFPFIRLVSPSDLAGLSENQRATAIKEVFLDSYESSLSLVIVDDIERLLGWTPIGQRFSNVVFHVLLAHLQRCPPKGRRSLVIATTSNRNILTELQMSEVFHAEFDVHPISTLRSLEYVLRSVDVFSDPQDRQRALRCVEQAGFGCEKDGERGKPIGIKYLINMMTAATGDPEEIIRKLVETLGDADYDPTNSDGSGYGRPLTTW